MSDYTGCPDCDRFSPSEDWAEEELPPRIAELVEAAVICPQCGSCIPVSQLLEN